jgi:hypothetical protein
LTAVSLPCTLTVLLQLRVYTISTANPIRALNTSNAIVAEGDSVVQPDGRSTGGSPVARSFRTKKGAHGNAP